MTPPASFTRTRVDFLRHGEAQGGGYFRGSTDDPLTEQGWRQMFQQCLGHRWHTVISSPLRRCLSFASAWSQEQQSEVIVESSWKEIDFGEWEGKPAEEINRLQPGALEEYYANPADFTPPHAESYIDFSHRVQQAWGSLLTHYSGQDVLVVTHAGVIRQLLSTLFAIPVQNSFQIEVPHACLTRMSCFDAAAGRFVQLNFHRPI